MLKSLTVSNFKAFEKPVTIDFSATGNYEFNTEAVKDGIVKTAIMYGKNASGKSSLGLALFDIVANLTDNFVNPRNYDIYQNALNMQKPVEFEFHFSFNDIEVIYKYQKLNIVTIVAETLIINGNTVINYNKLQKDSGLYINLKGAENLNVDLRMMQISAVKLVKNNCVLESNPENEAFINLCTFVNKMLLFWSLDNKDFIGYSSAPGVNIVEKIVKNNHFEDLKAFFREAGFSEELVHSNHTGREQLYIKYDRTLLDFTTAGSTGMRSLLLVYYWLEDIRKLEKCPSFVCIDEFDAFYHFELAYFVVEKLKASNCQVLLTTHNTSIFTNDLLRPDCYYICAKDKIVNAHNATEKEIREGHNLEKLYRGGTFGL
jgi:AAA15 family ATPase/GTPase